MRADTPPFPLSPFYLCLLTYNFACVLFMCQPQADKQREASLVQQLDVHVLAALPLEWRLCCHMLACDARAHVHADVLELPAAFCVCEHVLELLSSGHCSTAEMDALWDTIVRVSTQHELLCQHVVYYAASIIASCPHADQRVSALKHLPSLAVHARARADIVALALQLAGADATYMHGARVLALVFEKYDPQLKPQVLHVLVDEPQSHHRKLTTEARAVQASLIHKVCHSLPPLPL